jgi:hypothetical protein
MSAVDPTAEKPTDLHSPARNAAVVTPNDAADLATHARALLIGTSGNLRVTTAGGQTLTIPSVPTGILPLGVKRVFADQTTAANITALW